MWGISLHPTQSSSFFRLAARWALLPVLPPGQPNPPAHCAPKARLPCKPFLPPRACFQTKWCLMQCDSNELFNHVTTLDLCHPSLSRPAGLRACGPASHSQNPGPGKQAQRCCKKVPISSLLMALLHRYIKASTWSHVLLPHGLRALARQGFAPFGLLGGDLSAHCKLELEVCRSQW